MKIIIDNDVFNISHRLREIDSTYFVIWNTNSRKFEVHSSACKPTLCLVLPFDNLDVRAVEYTWKTRIENYNNLISNIEKNNLKIQQNIQNKINDKTNYQLHDIYKYGSSTSKEYRFENAYCNQWV